MPRAPQNRYSPPPRRRSGPVAPVWQQLNRLLVIAISLGLAAIIGAKFWPEYAKWKRLQVRTRVLEVQEAQLQFTRDRLLREVERIQQEPEYLELLARDRLDLVRPGETVFRFVDRPAEK